jgi:two-component system CheB/CheR fusion protein
MARKKAKAPKPSSSGRSAPKETARKKSRQVVKASGKRGATDPLSIVGIGASAGGLAALKVFFSKVPKDTGFAFVVVVHLSPEHKSHLAELLQPHVGMPVQQVNETLKLEPNRVYVIPPGANLDTIDTHLRLSELEELRQERAPIDHFFRTLAATHDGEAIGVILTGTGSDGTLGIKEIKERGGVTIVQDPKEAEYDGMPQSAIATGLVDLVLPLAKIPKALVDLSRVRPKLPTREEDLDGETRGLLQKVFAQLRARTGRDFSRYKRSTIMRRIQRRMQIRHVERLSSYLGLLRSEPEEVRSLGDDLLITVTNFFRDPEVFQALEQKVIPALFKRKGPDDDVRVWSVGCATGEEAYSLAILLLEQAAKSETRPRLQVFASDLHERSLQRAREGFYPGDIETDVSPERLKKYFVKENGGYRIRKELREMVVFAPHNLLGDPPFSRLDLVSCRNLLIYLQREVQRDVIELFHYALKPDGWLALGTSETVDSADLFQLENKKCSIYRKRNVPAPEPRLPVFPLTRTRTFGDPERTDHETGEPVAYGKLHQMMAERYAPPSALITPDDRVVHLSQHAGRYFIHPGGELTSNVLKLVREELRIELRAALHSAREKNGPASSRPMLVRFNGESAPVVIHVRPSQEPEQTGFVLVMFEEREPGSQAASSGQVDEAGGDVTERNRIKELEAELDLSRQRLQAIIEEYETSQEEMKASNEETQSTNEELRSTMEELETSKEELQSMNEELQTVNQEHRHKVEELAQMSGDLQNLLAASDIATLFLDKELRILRFTPKVSELFNVRMTDRGREIADFTHRLGYGELIPDAERVLAKLIPVEREVQDQSGDWYIARLLPYRSSEDRIEGVVLTCIEITARKQAEVALRESKEYAEQIIETLPEPLLVLGPDLRVHSVNHAFYEQFRVDAEATVGRQVYDLGNGQWNIPALRKLLEEVLPDNQVFNNYQVEHRFEDLGLRVMLLNARRLDTQQLILVGIRDITDRYLAEQAVRASEERLQRMINVPGVGVLNFDKSGTLLNCNDAFLQMTGYSREQVEQHRLTWRDMTPPEYIAASEEQMARLQETGRIGPYEKEYVRKDGRRSWMLFTGASMADGTVVEYCIDVGNRKKIEQRLRESEERYRVLVESTREYAMLTLDRERRITMWSSGAVRIFGYSEQEAVGQSGDILFTPEDRAAGIPEWEMQTALQQGKADDDRWQLRQDGSRFWASGVTEALRRNEEIYGFAKVLRDNTQRKQAEEDLRRARDELEERVRERTAELEEQAQRLRSLAGDLASAERRERKRLATLLHDDLQQLLVAAIMRIDSVKDRMPDEHCRAELASVDELLSGSLDRCRHLTSQLRPPALYEEGLAPALRWLAAEMKKLHGLEVAVETDDVTCALPEDVRALVFEAVRELLFNVVKHAEVEEALVLLDESDGHMEIVVEDHGAGFDPAGMEPQRDNGLGLFSVEERLAALGGSMEIDSAPGEGCRVKLIVPVGARN